MPDLSETVARELELRAQLRDAVQTLSNARRAEVWEIVNKLVLLGQVRSAPQ